MRHLYLLAILLTAAYLPAQDLEVFELFTDHAVLQRNVAHPIWGWTKPNRRVRVTYADEVYTGRADRSGKWSVELPAQQAGGPHVVSITDGRQTITLRDVYFGDVYLLSGQSNMEWRLAQSDPDSTRAGAIADPLIRQILVAKTAESAPAEHLQLDEPWKPGTKREIADFSGVGSYFAHYLRESGVDVPIGLVHSSWGGSRIEPWIPAARQTGGVTVSTEDLEREAQARREKVTGFYRQQFPGADLPPPTETQVNTSLIAADADTDGWATTTLPGLWEGQGYADVDGVFYYRKTFNLSEAQATRPAILHLGPIDDNDRTYLNGTEVGATNLYSESREYKVPTGLLRAGENTLAVRVEDTGGGGGFYGQPDSMYLGFGADKVNLAGDYFYRIGGFRINTNSGANQTPTLLYNAMIAPLGPLPLTGVLWYQGESNAGPQDALKYAEQMRALVGSWRDQFASDSLPFYWVQLANYMAPPTGPDEPGWALLRDQQTRALDLPNTGQAIITDIGEADDIHPKNKWEVGRRLSLHARKDIYGQDVQAASPVATAVTMEEGTATITFAEVGEGLTVHLEVGERYPIVRSLSVRDDAGSWHWAVGWLSEGNNALHVINPAGTGISAVRYAWFNNPDDANLFSEAGLPVTPFEITVDGGR